MRILLLTRFFPPERGAPQIHLAELGERLIDHGWEVEALTAIPNYPIGRIIGDYSAWKCCVEQLGRIQAVRVPLYPVKKGFVRRMISYSSFILSASYFGPKRCRRPDIILVESPPLFVGNVARYLAWRWRCPYVFNVSDLWPESAIRLGVIKAGAATRLAERLELSLYRHAAAVTGQSDEIVTSIRKRSPETPNDVMINAVATDRYGRDKGNGSVRSLFGDAPGPIFFFLGSVGPFQRVDSFLDIAENWPADLPGRFVVVAEDSTREHINQRMQSGKLPRVTVLPPQPRELVPALMAASDVAYMSLERDIPRAVPTKIYEAMASSLPLVLCADGEPARRIQRAQCGLVVKPGDLQGAQQACLQLASDAELRGQLGEAGRRAAIAEYSNQCMAERLHGFLTRVVENS